MSVIREPYGGIHFYADPSAETVIYRGHRYILKEWRESFLRATQLADVWRADGYNALIRKIAFRRGGLFAKGKGKRVIHRYGVYVRK